MPYTLLRSRICVITLLLSSFPLAIAQDASSQRGFDVSASLQPAVSRTGHTAPALPPAVLWLKPLMPNHALAPVIPPAGGYTLLQKNKMFSPHLLVVPVGSVVLFPNQDPFFHNVFSLFDGKRFDLGLYEAGKTKAVTFSREGISYIFCNIHPEMSAVVLSLATPIYSIANPQGLFLLRNVPEGDYELHLWVEGVPQPTLERWVRHVHITADNQNLGSFFLDRIGTPPQHLDKFGRPYTPDAPQPY